jgi:hexosaminidase
MRKEKLKDEHELQGYFLNRVMDFLKTRGRKSIVWNDGLCDTLDPSATCQYWTPLSRKGPAQIARYVNAGGSAILSPVTRVYYDYPYAATPLAKTYAFPPMLRGVRKERAGNVLGVEAAIWTEWVDTEEKLFFNTLPRLAATAETGWSAHSERNYKKFLGMLQLHYALYERLGLQYAKNVEKPLPLHRRIRETVKFIKSETHAELLEQNRQDQ